MINGQDITTVYKLGELYFIQRGKEVREATLAEVIEALS